MTTCCSSTAVDWTDPRPELVADRTWRMAQPMPGDGLPAVNCYVLIGRDRTLVIDVGCAVDASVTRLADALLGLNVDLSRTLAVATHVHSDHYPGSVLLRRQHGVTIGLGEGERASVQAIAGSMAALEPQIGRLRRAGAFDLIAEAVEAGMNDDFNRHVYEAPDCWLRDGDTIDLGDRTIEVVATPGHTNGHVVFHENASGLLFTGDHLLPTITPSVGFEVVSGERPLAAFLESLARLARLPDRQMMPAHGAVGAWTHRRVLELLAHHDERFAVCAGLVSQPITASDVAAQMIWTRHGRSFQSLDLLGRVLAVLEAAEHLDTLVDRGLLVSDAKDAVTRYAPPAVEGN